MSSGKGWVTPFLAGIVTAMAANAILQRKNETKDSKSSQATSSAPISSTNTSSTRSKIEVKGQSKAQTASLMDTPTLDNRILRKAEAALRLRTSRLILVIERCTNDHNYSAILRTAEALGVQHVYIIAPQVRNSTLKFDGQVQVDIKEESFGEGGGGAIDVNDNVKLFRSTGQQVRKYTPAEVQDRANHHLFAQRAVQWLQVKEFETTKECIDALRKDGYQIWSTDLSQVAVTLDEEGLRDENCEGKNIIPEKLAIVFGTEAVGCTAEILNASDKRVYLPLRGFADSLNLSVATALVVHQLFILDPTLIGAMPEEERLELRRHWYAKLCTQRLQTKSAKQSKKRLTAQIQVCEELEARANNPEMSEFPLQPEQVRSIE